MLAGEQHAARDDVRPLGGGGVALGVAPVLVARVELEDLGPQGRGLGGGLGRQGRDDERRAAPAATTRSPRRGRRALMAGRIVGCPAGPRSPGRGRPRSRPREVATKRPPAVRDHVRATGEDSGPLSSIVTREPSAAEYTRSPRTPRSTIADRPVATSISTTLSRGAPARGRRATLDGQQRRAVGRPVQREQGSSRVRPVDGRAVAGRRVRHPDLLGRVGQRRDERQPPPVGAPRELTRRDHGRLGAARRRRGETARRPPRRAGPPGRAPTSPRPAAPRR